MLDDGLQIGAIDELHDDEVRVVADTDVEHLNAVRVRQMRAHARLVEEHADELLLLGEVRQHALDGDGLLEPLEASAFGSEHLGHAARGDLLEDLVALLLMSHRSVASRAVRETRNQRSTSSPSLASTSGVRGSARPCRCQASAYAYSL